MGRQAFNNASGNPSVPAPADDRPSSHSSSDQAGPEWDLNCDLGEGEPIERTAVLFASITSANVACGGHAGDADTMKHCVSLARRHAVHLGAHPGIPGQFGRGNVELSPADLTRLLREQVGRLKQIAAAQDCRLHHVKLHGALYHLTDQSYEHAQSYLTTVRQLDPSLRIYAAAGGRVSHLAPAHGLEVWPEVFLDRGYCANGTLVPRGESGALLSTDETLQRVGTLLADGRLQAATGTWLRLAGKTFCLHGDHDGVSELAGRVHQELLSARRRRPVADSHPISTSTNPAI